MKILFISNLNPHFENTNIYRLRALKALGHEAIFFDDRDFILPGRIREKIPFLYRWDLRRLNRQMIAVANREKPELCLCVGGYRITSETLTKFKALGIKTALWTTDAPRPEFRQVIATAPCYDHIFCAGTEAMDILSAEGRLNTVWLPFACDPELHRPVELRDEDQSLFPEDIVFVGAYYPNRWQILKEIVGKYNIAIYGPGWQVVIDNRNRHAIHAGPVPPSTWVKMYSAARIILIIHYQDGVTPCFQASPKIFEAMSCRGFVITDVQKDVQTLFTSGRHLVSFADIDDLKDKIDFYLENEARRRLIADQGYEEVRRRHTYRHRMQTIIEHASLPS